MINSKTKPTRKVRAARKKLAKAFSDETGLLVLRLLTEWDEQAGGEAVTSALNAAPQLFVCPECGQIAWASLGTSLTCSSGHAPGSRMTTTS